MKMLRQLQSVLLALQVVQLVVGTNNLLPMELYEVAHSHQQHLQQSGNNHNEATSLHDLLIRDEHFMERTRPMSQVSSTDAVPGAPTATTMSEDQPRKHRGKGGGGHRRNRMQHRQGRQMSQVAGVRPEIYYVVGVSNTELHKLRCPLRLPVVVLLFSKRAISACFLSLFTAREQLRLLLKWPIFDTPSI